MYSSTDIMDLLSMLESSLFLFFNEIEACNDINIAPSPHFSIEENNDMTRNGHIHRAIKSFSDIWYTGDEDGRTTRTYQGVIVGSNQLIELAKIVNHHKENFHEGIKQYTRDMTPSDKVRMKDSLSNHLFGRKRLSNIRLQRINLNACYRKIPCIDEPAHRISYSLLLRGKSIKKMKVSEVRKMLKELGGEPPYPDRINLQLSILNQFSDSMPMARVQDNTPIIKANIGLEERDIEGNLVHIAKKPPLPFVLPGHQLPKIKFYSENESEEKKQTQARKIREDKQIEDEPTIWSLRVHRYIKE